MLNIENDNTNDSNVITVDTLTEAINEGNYETINEALRTNPDLFTAGNGRNGSTPLIAAIKKQDIKILELVEKVSPNSLFKNQGIPRLMEFPPILYTHHYSPNAVNFFGTPPECYADSFFWLLIRQPNLEPTNDSKSIYHINGVEGFLLFFQQFKRWLDNKFENLNQSINRFINDLENKQFDNMEDIHSDLSKECEFFSDYLTCFHNYTKGYFSEAVKYYPKKNYKPAIESLNALFENYYQSMCSLAFYSEDWEAAYEALTHITDTNYALLNDPEQLMTLAHHLNKPEREMSNANPITTIYDTPANEAAYLLARDAFAKQDNLDNYYIARYGHAVISKEDAFNRLTELELITEEIAELEKDPELMSRVKSELEDYINEDGNIPLAVFQQQVVDPCYDFKGKKANALLKEYKELFETILCFKADESDNPEGYIQRHNINSM